MNESAVCPACGGSGGGPFGPPGSAWDVEDYRCPRCAGRGSVELVHSSPSLRPLAKGGELAAAVAAGPQKTGKARLARTKATNRKTAASSAGQKKR